jgi:hypothetical protein
LTDDLQRRCIHDETGKIDPSKQNESTISKPGGRKSKSIGSTEGAEGKALEDLAASAISIDPALMENGEDPMDLDSLDILLDDGTDIEASIELHHPADDERPAEDLDIPLDPLLGGTAVDRSLLPSTPSLTNENAPENVEEQNTADRSRNSSRHSRHIERFSTAQYESPRKPSKANARNSTSPSFKSIKATSSTGKSTSPTTIGKSASPSVGSHKHRQSFGAAGAKRMSPTSMPVPTSPEEDASLRMAMQLQAEEFGLRSRRGT